MTPTTTAMTLQETLKALEKLGDIRTLAKKIKTNHALGLALWKTGNAQLLATLLVKPKDLSADEKEESSRIGQAALFGR